jgi:hypothetical protein
MTGDAINSVTSTGNKIITVARQGTSYRNAWTIGSGALLAGAQGSLLLLPTKGHHTDGHGQTLGGEDALPYRLTR